MEEQLISKAVREGVPWDQLPKRAKLFLGSNEEYIRRIKEHCFQLRLRWPDSPARLVCREVDYYNELIAHGRKTQAPFPYHLADYICRVLRISPFRYYSDLLLDVMKQEKSYDTIPNFTAADALRETGIGRNQFIDIMNRARAKLMWRVNRGIVKDMLPLEPVPFPIQPWWLVCVVNLTADEYRRLTEEELSVIERGGHEGDCMAGEFDEELVRSLYCKGLVYLDVPVYPNDRFRVSSLEGFVSNRNQQGEDASEKYHIRTVAETSLPSSSAISQAALLAVCDSQRARHSALDGAHPSSRCAASIHSLPPPPALLPPRLIYSLFVTASEQATRWRSLCMKPSKKSPPESSATFPSPSPRLLYSLFVTASEQATVHEMANTLQADVRQLGAAISLACRLGWAEKVLDLHSLLDHMDMGGDGDTGDGGVGSEGFGVGDAGVGAGMGGGEGGLEGVGGGQVVGWKKVESVGWGESGGGADRLRIALMVDANLTSFLMMGSFSYELKQHAVTLFEAGKLSERSVAELCGELRAVEKTQLEGELQKFTDHAFSLRYALSCLRTGTIDITSALHTPRPASAAAAAAAATAPSHPASRSSPHSHPSASKSLQGLAPATLHRLLRRDFDLVVSIVPLPKPLNAVVPDGSGPAHFGPPAPAFLSPWAKLFLYAKTASGPVSVVLMRGLRLRLLPPPLVTCDKALVWTWDGMAVGGVGAKSEGSLVPGTVLLHVVNSLLRHSAVMVQPLAGPPAPAPGFSRTGEARAADGALSQAQKQQGGGRSLGRARLGGTETAEEAVGGAAGGDEGRRSEGVEGEGVSDSTGGDGGDDAGAVEQGAGQQWEEESPVVAAARRAAEVLAVDAVGFVRVIRTEAGEEDDEDEEDAQGGGAAGAGTATGEGRLRIDVSGGEAGAGGTRGSPGKKKQQRRGEWVAHSVEFGIPLFHTHLCCQVCDAVVSHSMLTPPQLASQRRSTLSLRSALREFISDYRQHGPVSRAVYTGNVALLRSTSRRWSASFAASTAAASPFSVLLPRRTVRHVPPSPSGRGAGERAPSFAATQDDPQDPYAQSNRDPSFTSEEEEDDLSRPAYPGVNMIFDGHLLLPIDLSTYLHGRQASVLVARATSMSQQSIMW
ncbi:unnamed protein product [Closterium sp. Yama58-4]|nr:unnamed protein product [Closterium sp. Yama58-4]